MNASYNQEAKGRCNGAQSCNLTAIAEHFCPPESTVYLQGEYKCVQSLGEQQEICDCKYNIVIFILY